MSGRGQTERSILVWAAAGLLAALLLPWYGLQEGLAGVNWVAGLWSSEDYAGGIVEIFAHGKWWLAPTLAALVVCIAIGVMPMRREHRGTVLASVAAAGLAHGGEGFDEDIVEGRALFELELEFRRFGGEFGVGEGLVVGLASIDGFFERLQGLDLPVRFGAEDFREYVRKHRQETPPTSLA